LSTACTDTSSICPRYSRSPFGILNLGASQDFVTDPAIEELGRDEIHTPATKESRELVLQPNETESRNMPGLELHEHVDVAIGAEVVPQDGAEEGESPDVVAPAELGIP
jgi:hypothetical protein